MLLVNVVNLGNLVNPVILVNLAVLVIFILVKLGILVNLVNKLIWVIMVNLVNTLILLIMVKLVILVLLRSIFQHDRMVNGFSCQWVTLSLTDLVSQSLRVLLLLTYKEEPWRLVTFETLDQIDEKTYSDKIFDNLDFFLKI